VNRQAGFLPLVRTPFAVSLPASHWLSKTTSTQALRCLNQRGKVLATSDSTQIQHTVAFRLRHPAGSSDEAAFLEAARALATIPGVEEFQQLRQVSPKSHFTFFFSMRLADEDVYQGYNEHPVHVAFVRDRWDAEVSDFQELDFVALDQGR
jgi:hypothetical protein